MVKSRSLMLVDLIALAFLTAASLALAAETSRAEYVAAVEPICEMNTKANERILKGVRAEVREGKLKQAVGRLARASSALKKTLTELQAIPRPPGEAATLNKWLGYVKTEVRLFSATAKKLNEGEKAGAEKLAILLTRNANLANDTVLDFEFHYCRFEPARFT
jgi:hypothetical protein